MNNKTTHILSGNRVTRLSVQIADTPLKIQKGLMFVEHLPENEGMLFVYPRKIRGGFWMKNTFIPLSIAFLDSDGKILRILDMEPCRGNFCPIYNPQIPFQFAIEVNRGWFEKNQISEGDFVRFGT